MGTACLRTSSSTPSSCMACMPRVETARLIERPAEIASRRISGRRSKTSTSSPRFAKNVASSDPTGPAPTSVTFAPPPVVALSARMIAQYRGKSVDVNEFVIERCRCDTNDIGFAEITDHTHLLQMLENGPWLSLDAQRKLASSLCRVARGDDCAVAGRQAIEQVFQI